MKNSSDTIGNQTRDLPTCSVVPQPTALPRAPHTMCLYLNFSRQISEKVSNIKFHENPSNGSTLFRSERPTERLDESNTRFTQLCQGSQEGTLK